MTPEQEQDIRKRLKEHSSLSVTYEQDLLMLNEIDRLRTELAATEAGAERVEYKFNMLQHDFTELNRIHNQEHNRDSERIDALKAQRAEVSQMCKDTAQSLQSEEDENELLEQRLSRSREALKNLIHRESKALPNGLTPYGHSCNWCQTCYYRAGDEAEAALLELDLKS